MTVGEPAVHLPGVFSSEVEPCHISNIPHHDEGSPWTKRPAKAWLRNYLGGLSELRRGVLRQVGS